jgi:DNA invertase Pin-like site-specific DNA recombinase
MASLAKMERELTVECTRAGLEVARQLDQTPDDRQLASGIPPRDVAKKLGMSEPTLYRWIPASARH